MAGDYWRASTTKSKVDVAVASCTEVDTGGERRAECRAAAGRRGRGGDRAAGTAPRGVRAPTLGQAAGCENNAAALEPFEQGAWLAAASAARGGAAGAKRRASPNGGRRRRARADVGQAAGGENNAAALELFEPGAWLAAASAVRGGAAGAKRRASPRVAERRPPPPPPQASTIGPMAEPVVWRGIARAPEAAAGRAPGAAMPRPRNGRRRGCRVAAAGRACGGFGSGSRVRAARHRLRRGGESLGSTFLRFFCGPL